VKRGGNFNNNANNCTVSNRNNNNASNSNNNIGFRICSIFREQACSVRTAGRKWEIQILIPFPYKGQIAYRTPAK
jgi:hypothetical protein